MRAVISGMSLVALVVAAACSDATTSQQHDAGTADAAAADSSVPAGASFAADDEPTGPALYVTVDTSDAVHPKATVWAAHLGAVFGIAAALRYDAAQLAPQQPRIEPLLGPDAAGEARYLIAARAGAVVLGAARRGPAAGEQEITAPVALAVVPLEVLDAGSSRLALERAQVRRADGSFVAVQVAGGTLTTGGAR